MQTNSGDPKAVPAGEILWSACPYPGLFWRPIDYVVVPNFVLFSLAALWIFRPFTLGSFPLALIILLVLLYGCWFRFVQDARLRRRTRYELTESGLTVWRAGIDYPVCNIPIHLLVDARPSWQSRSGISSIELPLRARDFAYSLFNEFDHLAPTKNPCRRLELLQEADEAAQRIRNIARNAASLRTTSA